MRRLALLVLIASIVVNAALGVAVLLAGNFGDLETKVLLTSLCISGASLLALACAPAWQRHRLTPIPLLGTVASVGGFALLIAGIWQEFESDPLAKSAGTLLIAGGASAYASLLALLPPSRRARWAWIAALALAFVLAAMLISLVWGAGEDNEWFARWLGVVAVLLAAFTVLVPVLGRLGRREEAVARAQPEEAVARAQPEVAFCPRCGAGVAAPAGREATCGACGARFAVRFL